MAKKPEAKKPEVVEDQIESSEESAVDAEETEVTESGESTITESVITAVAEPLELHKKIEKFVASIHSTGDAQTVHTLDKINHLAGSLKYSLPAAILAVQDSEIKAGLEALLKML